MELVSEYLKMLHTKECKPIYLPKYLFIKGEACDMHGKPITEECARLRCFILNHLEDVDASLLNDISASVTNWNIQSLNGLIEYYERKSINTIGYLYYKKCQECYSAIKTLIPIEGICANCDKGGKLNGKFHT